MKNTKQLLMSFKGSLEHFKDFMSNEDGDTLFFQCDEYITNKNMDPAMVLYYKDTDTFLVSNELETIELPTFYNLSFF